MFGKKPMRTVPGSAPLAHEAKCKRAMHPASARLLIFSLHENAAHYAIYVSESALKRRPAKALDCRAVEIPRKLMISVFLMESGFLCTLPELPTRQVTVCPATRLRVCCESRSILPERGGAAKGFPEFAAIEEEFEKAFFERAIGGNE